MSEFYTHLLCGGHTDAIYCHVSFNGDSKTDALAEVDCPFCLEKLDEEIDKEQDSKPMEPES